MSRVARALGAAALGAAAWSTLVEPQLFTVRRHTLPVLPEGSAPLRVLQISDLHLAPWQRRKIAWVRRLVSLRPDLVVLTGDQMGASDKDTAASGPFSRALGRSGPQADAMGTLLHTLRPFAGTPTVFVHGSNDYYGPILKNPLKYLMAHTRRAKRQQDIDNAALTRGYRELGFVDLNNAATRISLRGTEVELFGLGDPHIHYDDAARMRAAIEEVRAAGAPVRLGVVHAPYQAALNTLLDEAADVIFAGHTHGGQVRVPGIGALTANCDLPLQQARGLSVWYDAEHAAFLNVSAGLGGSIYSNIRFACRPEASLITLEAARP